MSFFSELKRRNVVRVAIAYVAVSWLVIQVVETLFPLFDLSAAAVRAVVVILAIGFVPAVIMAWVFELTPAGLMRDRNEDHLTPMSQKSARRLDRIIVVVLTLALGYFAVDKFVLDAARDAALRDEAKQEGRTKALVESYGDSSIAVLPFLNISSDPEQVYLSDGIAEELLNLLTRFPELRVISRSSSFSFRGQDISVSEIAERLNVAHVLEGSVRKAGNRIRITAQLIDAQSNAQIWSQAYDRKLDDIFAIQDEIAVDVVGNLQITLLRPAPVTRRTNAETLNLTLQARHLMNIGSGDIRSVELLEQALDLDPDYVPALVQLGLALYLRANFGPAYSETDLLRNRSLIEKALTLEPDHGVANAYLGWGYFEYEKDLQKAARQLERAVQLAAGNAEVLRVASGFARRIGRFDAAVHLAGLAVERDPLCVACAAGVWGAYMEAGQYEQAIEVRRRWRHGGAGSETVGLSRLYSGDASAALKEFERGEVNEFAVDALRAMALHDVGRFDESVAALASHVANWSERHGNYTAMAYAWRGDANAAFEWLRKRYWPEMRGFHREIWNPAWRKLHDDPRWTNLRQQSGYTAEKFAAVEFNPELPN